MTEIDEYNVDLSTISYSTWYILISNILLDGSYLSICIWVLLTIRPLKYSFSYCVGINYLIYIGITIICCIGAQILWTPAGLALLITNYLLTTYGAKGYYKSGSLIEKHVISNYNKMSLVLTISFTIRSVSELLGNVWLLLYFWSIMIAVILFIYWFFF